MKPAWKILIASILALLWTGLAFAQGAAAGDLHVTVRDEKGHLVANATVTAREQAKGLERSTQLNTDGEYRLLSLPPGIYAVTVEAPGFGRSEAKDQSVTVGQRKDLPVTLTVSGGQTVITVSSEAELVETSRSSTTDTIDQRRIDNLPINGRNYINFALTDSQVLRDNAPSIGAAPTSGLNISGQRGRSNLVNVDGADAVDNSVNGVRSTVSQEAVQEFQIISNSYAAEYGRASGGVVNIITRSGSNEFHGDVYGYLRNRNFQATNPFSNVKDPAYTRVQGGVAFGGPLKKDKTYYYFSFETTRRHETGFASIGPKDAFGLENFDATNIFAPGLAPPGTFIIQVTPEQAAFLSSPVPPALVPLVRQYAFLAGGSSGIALKGSYPQSFGLLAQLGGIPTPANGSSPLTQFPTSCNNNNTVCNGLPSSFLTMNSQTGNFPIFENTSLYSLRLDHNINSGNRLMLRANLSPSQLDGIEVNGENQTFGQNAFSRTSRQDYHDVAGVVEDSWTIGGNKINELRFQYARRGLAYFYSNAPGGSTIAVNIPGFAFFGREPYSYIQRVEQRYQFTDNFSISKGRHDMKFGVDFNYIPIDATFTVNYGGVYNFGGLDATQLGFPSGLSLPGFSPVQAYGLGIPSTLVQGIGNPKDSFQNKPLGLFWEDSWKMRPNLTLNYGLRYDIEFPPKFTSPNAFALSAYHSLGLQKSIETDKNNFQPRIGLAYDPSGSGKTVIRASYGIFYDHPLLGLYFLGDASDGSKSGQLLFAGGSPCDTNPAHISPANLNATNIFQGILTTNACLPTSLVPNLGYLPNEQRFDAFFPNSLFINQNYVAEGFPLGFQPFGYPQSKNFVYAYSQQANFTIEQDLGSGFALSLAYNYNGGRHLNRPINANTVRGDLLVRNWQAAVAAASAPPYNLQPGDRSFPSNPLFVGTADPAAFAPCGVGPAGPYIPAALVNFFRPSGFNPSLMNAYAPCVPLAASILQGNGLNASCDPTTLANCVPFSDMDANYSNGSSVYHGFTANLRKRFNKNYEFLASYTWSHAIDDSTDLQSPLAPQDSFFPALERSNSTFDQRHRFVFSGLYQTGKLSGGGFGRGFLSNWTFAPIIEIASGRPFLIITGETTNFQFSPSSARPNIVTSGTPNNACGPTIPSKYSPAGAFQLPCYADGFDGTLFSLDGNLTRNAGFKPWNVFNDLRVAKRIYFGERLSLDAMVDIFNIANKFNVADVNPLWTNAGRPTAAYDPRQFQFALKVNW
ncbi:MAG TPA: TonB-dependent receptor [Terriglobales bacterium]|nr:TonB-dependent receptor [Terriglobales bacterium]